MEEQEKLALITGGSRGIGYCLAQYLAAKGIAVVTTSRNAVFEKDFSCVERGKVFQQYLDVTKEDSVKKLFSWIKLSKKKLSILVNNAGIGVFKPIEEITLPEWELTLKINLTGAFLCAKEASGCMKAEGGRIINIGSIAEKIPFPNNLVYAVSKQGLKGLSAIFAEEKNSIR